MKNEKQTILEEKEEWINGLARIYKKQGLKVKGTSKGRFPKNEILQKIHEVTGLSKQTVKTYLLSKFKQKYPENIDIESKTPIIPASKRIEHDLGKDYVERHREEVITEERPKIEQEVRKKKVGENVRNQTSWVSCLL